MENEGKEPMSDEDLVEETVEDTEDTTTQKKPTKKRIAIIAVIVAVLVVAGAGVAIVLTSAQPEEIEDVKTEQVSKADEVKEKESKVFASVQMKEAGEVEATESGTVENEDAIEIAINVFTGKNAKEADNAHENDKALKITNAEIGKKVEVGSFKKGSYHLHVDLPVFEDGTSYVVDEALSDLAFEVDGKGKDINLKIVLNYLKADGTVAETSEEAGETAATAATAETGANTSAPNNDTPASNATNNSGSTSNSSNSNAGSSNNTGNSGSTGNSGGSNNSGGNSDTTPPAHSHSWAPVYVNGAEIMENGAPIYGNGAPIKKLFYICGNCGFESESVDILSEHRFANDHGAGGAMEKVVGYEQVIIGYHQVGTGRFEQVYSHSACSCGATKA